MCYRPVSIYCSGNKDYLDVRMKETSACYLEVPAVVGVFTNNQVNHNDR